MVGIVPPRASPHRPGSGLPSSASCRTVVAVLRRAFDWTFRSREDGRIVVAQVPNLPLWLFIGGSVLHRVLTPDGPVGTALRVTATTALVWWAALEIGWGVNPFRRALGATVLGLTAWGLVSGA